MNKLCGTEADWSGFVKVRVSRIPADALGMYWNTAWTLLEPARRPGANETEHSIKAKITSGEYQLWGVFEEDMVCAVVTMLIERGKELVLHVEYGGAEWQSLHIWKNPLVELLTMFAKHYGAVALECSGRPGWLRVFPGAKRRGDIMRKEI